MKSFVTIVNSFYVLTIVTKFSTLDICGGPDHVSDLPDRLFSSLCQLQESASKLLV